MRTTRALICARHLQCVVFFACVVAELKAAEKRVSAAELGVFTFPFYPVIPSIKRVAMFR